MTPFLIALVGFVQGPWLHSFAVSAGRDDPLALAWRCSRGTGHDGSLVRCGCGRWRWRELATSMVTGIAYWGMADTLGPGAVLVAHLVMASLTTMLIVTDFDHFRIPNRLLYPGTVLCVLLLAAAALLEARTAALVPALIGGAGYFALLFGVYVAARGEGFGFGDVKLAFVLGFFAGFGSWRTLAYALFITSILGGIPALILLAMGRSRKTAIPYGPPLIIGTWAAIIWAPYLAG